MVRTVVAVGRLGFFTWCFLLAVWLSGCLAVWLLAVAPRRRPSGLYCRLPPSVEGLASELKFEVLATLALVRNSIFPPLRLTQKEWASIGRLRFYMTHLS
jgi:hypothetical protein